MQRWQQKRHYQDECREIEMADWKPISTAPRHAERVLIYCPTSNHKVREAWWSIPYEGAPDERGWWQTMDGVVLSADLHFNKNVALGATMWQPLPDPPTD
jgi:hypothetical protein